METIKNTDNQIETEKYETQLHAQPYDMSASGFYFRSVEEYEQKSTNHKNDYGDEVEEYEIQFIDGDDLDCDLFKTLSVHQGNINHYFTACEDWGDDQKIKVIIAVGEAGYDFDPESDDPDDFDIDLYELESLKELAERFVEEGLFSEIRLNGTNYIYRVA